MNLVRANQDICTCSLQTSLADHKTHPDISPSWSSLLAGLEADPQVGHLRLSGSISRGCHQPRSDMLKVFTLLVCLLFKAEAKGRRGGGGAQRGSSGSLCFGEGCSLLRIRPHSDLPLHPPCHLMLLLPLYCFWNESTKEEDETGASNCAANQQRLLLV